MAINQVLLFQETPIFQEEKQLDFSNPWIR